MVGDDGQWLDDMLMASRIEEVEAAAGCLRLLARRVDHVISVLAPTRVNRLQRWSTLHRPLSLPKMIMT